MPLHARLRCGLSRLAIALTFASAATSLLAQTLGSGNSFGSPYSTGTSSQSSTQGSSTYGTTGTQGTGNSTSGYSPYGQNGSNNTTSSIGSGLSGQQNGQGPQSLMQPGGQNPQQGLQAGQPNQPGMVQPYVPGEFEQYVQALAYPAQVFRLGADLMLPSTAGTAPEASPLVPSDYVIVPGDELNVSIWGSVDADLRLIVDRSGRIFIPRVGPITVAGVTYAELRSTISARVAKVFKNFEVSASLAQMRAIRIYVTGFVVHPGVYSVTNLSTISSALIQAGGPTAAGSFRSIQLRRKGKPAVNFDLYELISLGNRNADIILQPDDVIHVDPVGPQVAFLGSVNSPAVVELKSGETVENALKYVGGFTSVADTNRLSIERLANRDDTRIVQLSLPGDLSQPLRRGDVVRAFSSVEAKIPVGRQNKRVIVEGEVLRPGQYILPPNSSIQDALKLAGGLAPQAYVFGTQFTRESVRLSQEENYDRALRDLETDLTRYATTQRAVTADEVKAQDARTTAAGKLVERLRAVRPTGRVVLQVQPDATGLPPLMLEDGDRIYIPSHPTSVGVFGSVFNANSYLYSDRKSVQDYVELAGGPTRGADKGSTFVIRANGSVVSALQDSTWLTSGSLDRIPALPGDTVFVPEELDKTTFVQGAKDWTQIIYQLGLGAAALKAVQ